MFLAGAITLLLAAAPSPTLPSATKVELDAAVFVEMNRVRMQPAAYLPAGGLYAPPFEATSSIKIRGRRV